MGKIRIENVDKNMKATEANDNSLVFYNPIKCKKLVVEGLPFFYGEKKYVRIPEKNKTDVSEAVAWLSNQPSGGQIRFKTNSKKIVVRVKNTGDYQMCHMTSTGQQGVDLYYKVKGQKKYKFFTCAKFAEPTSEFESIIFEADEQFEKDIIINLPLYEGLGEILIGLDTNASLKKAKPHKNKGRIVWYGTSITQGGCATRPGMSYSNIISRDLDQEQVNLGFSGSGLGEPELAKIITQIDDVAMIILDYDANGGGTGTLEAHMEEFIDILRNKWCDVPIVIISKILFTTDIFSKSLMELRNRVRDFQKQVVDNRNNNGDYNIYFIDGSTLVGKDKEDCFVDGIHLTDLGFLTFANNIEGTLKKILKKKI